MTTPLRSRHLAAAALTLASAAWAPLTLAAETTPDTVCEPKKPCYGPLVRLIERLLGGL